MRIQVVGPLLAAALASAGCSFVAVRRPPPEPSPPGVPIACTESRTAPVLDTVGAVATPIVGAATWGLCAYLSSMQSWASDPTHLKCGAVIWGALLGTAAYTGSAVYGFHHTNQCRRLAEQGRPIALPSAPVPRLVAPPAAVRPVAGDGRSGSVTRAAGAEAR
jgi:hypothetical protein